MCLTKSITHRHTHAQQPHKANRQKEREPRSLSDITSDAKGTRHTLELAFAKLMDERFTAWRVRRNFATTTPTTDVE